MAMWWPLLGLLSCCPIFKSSHCNSFEDWTPVDFTCLIIKWVAEACLWSRMLVTMDSRYVADEYNTVLNTIRKKKAKTLFRLWTHKDTPYLALTGELWGIICEFFRGKIYRARYRECTVVAPAMAARRPTHPIEMVLGFSHSDCEAPLTKKNPY